MKKIGPAEFEEIKEKYQAFIKGIKAQREDLIELQRKFSIESTELINDLGKALNKAEQAYRKFIEKYEFA